MKKIVILGSTGQIGRQTLEIIKAHPGEFKVVGISANKNIELLKQQVQEFKPTTFAVGEKDLERLATLKEADMVVVAVVGLAGLKPTLAAVRAGKDVALATKEVLVLAGELVMKEVNKHKVKLIPIDSEHSAIFQCLQTGKKKEIKRLILTMGKGPIAKMRQEDFKRVTLKDIFNRSAWKMGNKITIDSATCINKSFEVIEAKWLFAVSPEKINIVVQPEYLCHSMVEFVDGSIIAEIGTPDMKRYIQYALFYPQRKKSNMTTYADLIGKKISFEAPPFNKFPGLKIGFEALKKGGTMPAAMHGADESAVKAFLKKRISFIEIPLIIKKTIKAHKVIKNPNLEEILKAESWGRIFAQRLIDGCLK